MGHFLKKEVKICKSKLLFFFHFFFKKKILSFGVCPCLVMSASTDCGDVIYPGRRLNDTDCHVL